MGEILVLCRKIINADFYVFRLVLPKKHDWSHKKSIRHALFPFLRQFLSHVSCPLKSENPDILAAEIFCV
jgi:hypothetical protein